MTLLVVGLVFGFSSVSFGDAVLGLKAQDTSTITVDDSADNVIPGIPLLRFSVTNTEATSIELTEIKSTNGDVTNGNDWELTVIDDANDNGLWDDGDTVLVADVANSDNDDDETVLDITDTDIAAGDSLNMLIVTKKLASAEPGDLITIVINTDDLTITEALTVSQNGDNDLKTNNTANTPSVTTADGAGSVTTAAHTVALTAGDFPNKKDGHVVAAFNIEGDDAAISHVLDAVRITTAGTAATADFDNARIYVDVDNNGAIGAGDAELTLGGTGVTMGGPNNYSLTTPVFIKNTANINFLLTIDGQGTADKDETITASVTAAGTTIDGGIASDDDLVGVAMTMDAITATLETVDVTGPPYGRPNGFLDAIKVTFDIEGTAAPIDDDLMVDAEWDVIAVGGGNHDHTQTFTATYNSDVADNSVVYFVIDEDSDSITEDQPTVAYTQGATLVTDSTGDYALATFTATAALDKAPPAPLGVTMLDSDGNGKIEQIRVDFSEAVTAGDHVGFTFPGLELTGGATAGGALAAPFDGANMRLNLTVTEDGYNTGAVPAYTYTSTTGLHTDGSNEVQSFNYLALPAADGAAPTLVKATTGDADSDGMFDQLTLLFSEDVQLNANISGITVDDLEDNTGAEGFNFGAAHNPAYNFAGSGHTLTGDTVVLKVNEVGSLDTAVQPSLLFNKTAIAEKLTDTAATPNVLAVQAGGFTMVSSASGVVSPVTVWLADGISPQITAAVTLDGSAQGAQNGKLDAIKLTFSEAMGTDISSYEDLVISGVTIEEDSTVVTGVDVLVGLVEDAYNTGLEPTITYSGDTIEDASGAKLGNISEVAEDNAVPMLVTAVTKDMGYGGQTANNGQIDGMAIMFSEPMNIAKLDDPYAVPANADGINDEFSFVGVVYDVADTVEVVDSQNMIIYITESGSQDTDQKPDLLYAVSGTAAADSNLVDMNGFELVSIGSGGITEEDGAPPVITTATTVDDDNDGKLDGVEITFGETVAEIDTAAVLAAVTLSEETNQVDLSAADVTLAGAVLTLVGTNNAGAEDWDTDDTPDLSIAAGNGIMDAADNVVVAVEDMTTTDGAAPVIGKAIAQTDTDNIVVTFSEGVTDESATPDPLEVGDFVYIYYADSTDVTTISSVTAGATADVWNLKTDDILTEDHVAMDSLKVVAGKVEDLTGLAAVVNKVPISDIEIPSLVSATTMDVDVDGYIDTIELVFSEEVRDANLNNWDAETDTLVVVPNPGMVPRWVVEGYTVIGINKTQSDAGAETASDMVGNEVYNVNDVADDETLYLSIVEGASADTRATPLLTMQGNNSGGSGVSDYSPNYVPTVTDYEVTDGAGVAILEAMMTSTTTMEVKLSESIYTKASYLNALSSDIIISWLVGTEEREWKTNVVNISYPTSFGEFGKTRMVFEVDESKALEPGWISTVALVGGTIQDNSGDDGVGNVLNAATLEAIDVTPAEDIVAVESLPGEFSLGANYPNPFNPTTTIEYAIPADGAGLVELVIYNMNGQKVCTLVNETQDAGYYNVVWDGRNDAGELVSSGIYVYRIVSGSFSQNQRMTFIK